MKISEKIIDWALITFGLTMLVFVSYISIGTLIDMWIMNPIEPLTGFEWSMKILITIGDVILPIIIGRLTYRLFITRDRF